MRHLKILWLHLKLSDWEYYLVVINLLCTYSSYHQPLSRVMYTSIFPVGRVQPFSLLCFHFIFQNAFTLFLRSQWNWIPDTIGFSQFGSLNLYFYSFSALWNPTTDFSSRISIWWSFFCLRFRQTVALQQGWRALSVKKEFVIRVAG